MSDVDEILILQVQSFPVLYNKKDPTFKNKLAKENAWTTIAGICKSDPATCEQRWTTLRAKYTNLKKKIRDMPSGSGGTEISWPCFDIMKFLDPFLVSRRTISNFKGSETVTTINSWDTMVQLIEGESTEEKTSESSTVGDTPLVSPTVSESPLVSPELPDVKSLLKKKPEHTIISKETEISTQKRKKNNQEELVSTMTSCFQKFGEQMERKKSEDEAFVLSLAKDIEVLTLEEKIIFKRNVYSLLSEIISNREK